MSKGNWSFVCGSHCIFIESAAIDYMESDNILGKTEEQICFF